MLQRPSKYEAGPQKCCNSLQIEGKGGCYLGPNPLGGGWVERRRTGPYIYNYIYIYIYLYVSILYMYIYGIETFNVQTIIITRKPMFLFAQEDILVGHWCLPLTEVWSFVDFSAHTATIAGTWACCQMWHHPSRCEARELDAIWPQTLGLIHFRETDVIERQPWRNCCGSSWAQGSTWNFWTWRIQDSKDQGYFFVAAIHKWPMPWIWIRHWRGACSLKAGMLACNRKAVVNDEHGIWSGNDG